MTPEVANPPSASASSTARPRVLHVIDHTGAGGAQAVLRDLIGTLKDRYTFGVAVLGASGTYSTQYAALGATILELGTHSSRWSFAPLGGVIAAICHGHYDLVHTHLFKGNTLGVFAARLAGRRVILHDYSGATPEVLRYFLPNWLIGTSYLLAYRLGIGLSQRAIVLTEQLRVAYERSYHCDPRKLLVLPNPVDVTRFADCRRSGNLRATLGIAETTPLSFMLGRLDPEKDWPTFLRVAEELQRRGRTCACLVVGSGTEEPMLREYARTHHLDQVHFLGYYANILELFGQADLFLQTSRIEALPVVILEAMASRLPVVATRTSGAVALIEHDVDGLLADVGDAVGLAQAVIRLLDDSALRDRLAACARQKVVASYSLEVVAARVAALYDEVLAG